MDYYSLRHKVLVGDSRVILKQPGATGLHNLMSPIKSEGCEWEFVIQLCWINSIILSLRHLEKVDFFSKPYEYPPGKLGFATPPPPLARPPTMGASSQELQGCRHGAPLEYRQKPPRSSQPAQSGIPEVGMVG